MPMPALRELAVAEGVPVAGNDGKTGETLVKTVLAPMFSARALKVLAWQGYNMLGNRDGEVLEEPAHKAAKLENKDQALRELLSDDDLHSEVAIDFVPSLNDWKTAWDFIHFEGFLGAKMSMQFTWQGSDSALAAPLILDLAILAELASRITYKKKGESEWHSFHPVLSLLSYMLKAPMVPPGTPVVNSLFKQRSCIENILRACVGLPPDSCMALEHKQGPSVADPNPAKKQKVTANGA